MGGAEAALWGGSVLELNDRAVRRLGPDILARPPDFDRMVVRLRRADQAAVGDALLDQRLVAGIGNVWRAEALWRARVSRGVALREMTDEELRTVLGEAARMMRGSVDGDREERAAQQAVHVLAARRRSSPAARATTTGTAYWCPRCQPGT